MGESRKRLIFIRIRTIYTSTYIEEVRPATPIVAATGHGTRRANRPERGPRTTEPSVSPGTARSERIFIAEFLEKFIPSRYLNQGS